MTDPQASLFELAAPQIEPVAASEAQLQLAAALPKHLHLGGMSWSYPGWTGVVYERANSEKQLAAYGLTAYARQPLLRAAEIDRSYYEPLASAVFRAYAEQVPDDFRFLVKAHEECTVQQFPLHARYGKKRGQLNPRFLDPEYAARAVVEPLSGLGHKLFALLFQLSPQAPGEPGAFAERLHAFLGQLPVGPTYAVELRNAELLTPEYASALADAGAIHCHNAWTYMPSVLTQAKRLTPNTRRPLLIRWLLKPHDRYEQANARFEPFDRIRLEDPHTRAEVATLAARALAHDVPACVLVDNKAEGCAPLSIDTLAQAILNLDSPR
jgi:uncharacterized protein YecE (DUF72 family)